MAADARRLLELSMVPILAKEVAAQITAGVGDKRRLLELTMPPRLALEVANQITAVAGDRRRLVELGMVPRLALELANQITSGSVVYTTTIIESRVGSVTVVPVYPNDRVVSAPWTAFIAKNDTASDHINIIKTTANFPSQTRFSSTYPADGGTSVRAFAFEDYGNYLDGIANGVAASQINSIASLIAAWDFSIVANPGTFNGAIDWFLFSSTAGTTATIVDEIQVFWETPASTKTGFLDTLPVVGTYASPPVGITPATNWKVTYQAANAQGKPYFQFRPIDGSGNSLSIRAGSFDMQAAMVWLMTQNIPSTTTKCLTGSEYYTGHGNGYEILNGSVQLDINAISTTYSQLIPPTGFVFLIDYDGSYITDNRDGYYLVEAA